MGALTCRKDLDVSPANIDYQHVHDRLRDAKGCLCARLLDSIVSFIGTIRHAEKRCSCLISRIRAQFDVAIVAEVLENFQLVTVKRREELADCPVGFCIQINNAIRSILPSTHAR